MISKVYAISDTHGETNKIEIPACDLLLHAGDIMIDGYRRCWIKQVPTLAIEWMRDVWLPWIKPMLDDGWVKHVVMTWGNHDWTMLYGAEIQKLMPPNVHILVDEEITVDGVRIYGLPWSNTFMRWSWMKDPELLKKHYDAIPEGVDIILSHQPPTGTGRYYDMLTGKEEDLGSQELAEAIDRVKPKVVVCGHIHSAYGNYQRGDTLVQNVSVVDEAYKVVRGATRVELDYGRPLLYK